jgi:hypothetical protein
MDTGLTFVPHMMSIVSKALKMLGFIFRNTSDFTNTISIKSLFYAFVRSKLEYCSVVWMPYNQVYISLLEKIQRKFAKYMYFKIHGHYPMQHCDESILLKSVELNSLLSRRNLNCLSFLQKLLIGIVDCPSLLNQIKIALPRIGSRSPATFYYDIPSTFHHFNSPLLTCLKLYNSLYRNDPDLDIFHLQSFKRTIKLKIMSKFTDYCAPVFLYFSVFFSFFLFTDRLTGTKFHPSNIFIKSFFYEHILSNVRCIFDIASVNSVQLLFH